MPRKYTFSDAARAALKTNSQKPRPNRKKTTEKWVNVRFPVEFVKKHKKPGEALHVTIEKKLKRKRPVSVNPPAKKDTQHDWVTLGRHHPAQHRKSSKTTKRKQGEFMMRDHTSRVIKIDMDIELLKKLKRAAGIKGQTVSGLIDEIAKEWLNSDINNTYTNTCLPAIRDSQNST